MAPDKNTFESEQNKLSKNWYKESPKTGVFVPQS